MTNIYHLYISPQIAFENLQSEADHTLEDEKKNREEEYKWEMEDYEKKLYEEEIRRQVRGNTLIYTM